MGANPNEATTSRWFDRVAVPLGLLICLGAGLAARGVALDQRSLWFDEAYSWRMSHNDEHQICERLRYDNSPPLYFLLLKYWEAEFGESPTAIRSLSVVAGLATVVGTFLFASSLLALPFGGPSRVTPREAAWVPLLAVAFVALNPLLVRYGCEARMYSLGTALGVFSGWALVRAIDPDRPRWWRWIGFAAVTTLFAYTHTFALLMIAAEGGVIGWWLCERAGGSPVGVVRQPAFRSAVVAFALIAIAFGFWAPTLLAQLSFSGTREWIPPLETYRSLHTVAYKMFVNPEEAPTEFGAVRAGVVAAVFLSVAAWRGRWVDGVLLTLGLSPIVGAAALCLSGTQVFLTRYFIFGLPFLLILLAVAVARVRSPAGFALAAVTAIGVHGYWCHDLWRHAAIEQNAGYRGAAEQVVQQGSQEDLVICSGGRTFFSTRFHLKDRPHVYAVYPPSEKVYGGAAVMDEREDFRPTDELVRLARRRVWVVNQEWGGRLIDPVPVPRSWREVSRTKYTEAFGMETVILIQYAVR